MKTYAFEQYSVEWYAVRLGIVTASAMDKIISPTGKRSTQADKYMNKLLAEVITGQSSETFEGNEWTERGKELEQQAADFYVLQKGSELKSIGFCTTDDGLVGCSPDRLVGEDGLLEIKCPAPHTFIEYALNDKLEQEYRPQTQAQLYITGRTWIDTMCFHPRIEPIIIRTTPDESFQRTMRELIKEFYYDFKLKAETLKQKGFMK